MRKKFKLSHSILGNAALLTVEALLVVFVEQWGVGVILVAATIGAIGNIYVSTEVIEEVRNARHMLVMLSATVAEFFIFFTFQYHFLLHVEPASFPTLGTDAVSLSLHSLMVFVFNPLYLPATGDGRALLFINIFGALGLVLFILQNVTQFRHPNAK